MRLNDTDRSGRRRDATGSELRVVGRNGKRVPGGGAEPIEDKRERIRTAAARVFADKGYHGATISRIAREADVGKGTVYLYFASKEDILLDILEHYFDRVLEAIERVERLDVDLADGVRAVLDGAVQRLGEDPDLFRIMEQQPILHHDRVRVRFEGLFREMVDRTAQIIRAGIERGTVRPCDPRIVAGVLLSTAASFPLHLSFYPEDEHGPLLSRLGAELADLIWGALRPAAAGLDR